jgi:putative membrane protein
MYAGAAILFLAIFSLLYAKVTPYCEMTEIKENKNIAASISYAGAMLGFSLQLMSAMNNSISLVDFAIWGTVAIVVQVCTFLLVRLFAVPKVAERIKNQEISAGVFLAGISISVGLLFGAAMNG